MGNEIMRCKETEKCTILAGLKRIRLEVGAICKYHKQKEKITKNVLLSKVASGTDV